MKRIISFSWVLILSLYGMGQQGEAISKPPNAQNPFAKFLGEWTLKNDQWEQSWDGSTTEHLTIPKHFSVCRELNTHSSLLWEVNAPSARGHILWTYNSTTKYIHHSSSFAPSRIGIGEGSMDEKGNIYLTLRFSGEPEGTFRKYSYVWLNDHEYQLSSRQYLDSGEATGNYYGGIFKRLKQ